MTATYRGGQLAEGNGGYDQQSVPHGPSQSRCEIWWTSCRGCIRGQKGLMCLRGAVPSIWGRSDATGPDTEVTNLPSSCCKGLCPPTASLAALCLTTFTVSLQPRVRSCYRRHARRHSFDLTLPELLSHRSCLTPQIGSLTSGRLYHLLDLHQAFSSFGVVLLTYLTCAGSCFRSLTEKYDGVKLPSIVPEDQPQLGLGNQSYFAIELMHCLIYKVGAMYPIIHIQE